MTSSNVNEIKLLNDTASIEYYLFNANRPHPLLKIPFDKTYATWKEIWKKTFKELDGSDMLYSNDFTRQDHINALFQNGECIALTLCRILDLDQIQNCDDSYFQSWPTHTITALKRDSAQVLICSYLAVAPHARDRSRGYSVKDLMVALNTKYFLESQASVIAATTRNDKNVSRSCQDVGGTTLLSDQKLHGVSVDLVGIYKKDIRNLKTPYTTACQKLWNKRITDENAKSWAERKAA